MAKVDVYECPDITHTLAPHRHEADERSRLSDGSYYEYWSCGDKTSIWIRIETIEPALPAMCPKPASADQIHLHVLKVLSSLTEAYEEIARLEAFSVMDDTFLTAAYAEITSSMNPKRCVCLNN